MQIGAETTALTAALRDVNTQSRSIQGELRQVERLLRFDPGNTQLLAQQQRLFGDAIENSRERLNRLCAAEQQVRDQFNRGEIDAGQMRAFEREVASAQQQLNRFETRLEQTGQQANRFSENIQISGDRLKDIGGKITAAGAGIVGFMAATTEGTRDFRTELAKLETNAQMAGASMDVMDSSMRELNAVTGETDSNVEGLSNLLAAGFKGDEFKSVMDELAGAAIKFKDTLDFEEVADGLQETLAVGEAADPFAELLERLGINLDDFNAGLQDAIVNGTQNNYVLKTLQEEGLSDVYEQYKKNNEALVESAEAQYDLQAALADLGTAIEPLATQVVSGISEVVDWFNSLDKGMQKSILTVAGVTAAVGPLMLAAGSLVGPLSAVSGLLGAGGVAGAATAAGGALAGVGSTVAALAGPVGITAAGVGVLAYNLSQDAVPAVDLFGEKVSENTQKAVQGFLDLNDQATTSLNQLNWSGQAVTSEMATSIVATFDQMSQQVVAGLNQQHQDSLASMQQYFTESQALTAEEEAEIISQMAEGYEKRKSIVADGEARIQEIMDQASEEKRALTQEEKTEINRIQQEMVDTGVRTLSQYEAEAEVIMERMKQQAGEITAQQAADVVKNSIEQRDQAIRAANQQYDQTLAWIIRQRDETGAISADQAQKLIDEATRQRDEQIKMAEETHTSVVEEAKLQSGEYVQYVDWMTGEVLSKWESMIVSIDSKVEKLRRWLRKHGFDVATEAEVFGRNIPEGMSKGVDERTPMVVGSVDRMANSVIETTRNRLQTHSPSVVMHNIGKDTVQGLADGINDNSPLVESAMNAIASTVSSIASGIQVAVASAFAALNSISNVSGGSTTASGSSGSSGSSNSGSSGSSNDSPNDSTDNTNQTNELDPVAASQVQSEATRVAQLTGQTIADLEEIEAMKAGASEPDREIYNDAQARIIRDFLYSGGYVLHLPEHLRHGFYEGYMHAGPGDPDRAFDRAVRDAVSRMNITPGSPTGQAESVVSQVRQERREEDVEDALSTVRDAIRQVNNIISGRDIDDLDYDTKQRLKNRRRTYNEGVDLLDELGYTGEIPELPSMPGLKLGGIVTGGNPRPFVLGDAPYAEAVLPLPKLLPMMTEALLGAAKSLQPEISSSQLQNQLHIHIENRGTIVGRNGMEEFADTVSKQIGRKYGLSVGGAW